MRPNYIMKTDDDTFVRVDEVLRGLRNTRKSKGLLYGSIEYNNQPRRDPTDKWYISTDVRKAAIFIHVNFKSLLDFRVEHIYMI